LTHTFLSVLRSDDRELMASRVEAIVAASGALCVDRLDDRWKPRCISLRIAAPGGLTVTLRLDGDAGRLHALHFLHWDMAGDGGNRLSPVFGGVRADQPCKATHVAYSFDALCEQLELSLRLAATGDAYQPAQSPMGQLAQAQ
jgi:hypothetical protein